MVVFHMCMVVFHMCMVIFHMCMVVLHMCMVVFHMCMVVLHMCMVVLHICDNQFIYEPVHDKTYNQTSVTSKLRLRCTSTQCGKDSG